MKIKSQITLFTAILININIMLGAGVFINPGPLTLFAGSLGFLGYILSALVLLPIVLSIAELAKIHPTAGGLYVYSKEYLNPFTGFISGWSYFIGKTTSAALLGHTFVAFFQRRIPLLKSTPIIFLDCLLILFLVLINIIGISVGGKIQYFFISMRIIPIFFVIFVGSFFFNPNFFSPHPDDFLNLFSTLPVAIFALLSFEMICSIGHLIKNPSKNIRRTILYSFFTVACISAFFQLIIFGAIGKTLVSTPEPILILAAKVFTHNPLLPKILNAFVFTAIIGGSFGSLTTNCWNLYALAKDKHLPGQKFLTKISKTNVPYVSLIMQGLVACLILIISKKLVPLQNMTVLGVVIAYMLSSVSLFKVYKSKIKILPLLAIISSCYIIFICIRNLFISGISIPVLMIFAFGLATALWNKFKHL